MSKSHEVEWCKECEGTGDIHKNKTEGVWDYCLACGGTGFRPFDFVQGTDCLVRDIFSLNGKSIKRIQVREGRYVEGQGHNAYEIVIKTRDGDEISISGDHDDGPNIKVLA